MKVVEVALMMVVVAVGARLGRGDTRKSGEHGSSSFRPSLRVSSNPHAFRPMGRDGRSFSAFSSPTSSYSSIASSPSFSSPSIVRANMVHKFSLPTNFRTATSRSTTLNFGDDSSEFFITSQGHPTSPQLFGSTSQPSRSYGPPAAPSQSYGPPAAPSKSYGPPSVGLRTGSLETSDERFVSLLPPKPSVGTSRPVAIHFDDSFERHTPSKGFSNSFEGLRTHTSNSFEHINPTRGFSSQHIKPTPHSFQSGSSFQSGPSFGHSTSHSGSFEQLRPQSISFDNSFERLGPSSFHRDDSIFSTLRLDDSSEHFPLPSTRFVTPTISPTASYITPTSSGLIRLSRGSHEDLSSAVLLRNPSNNFGSGGSRKSIATSIGGKSSEDFASLSIGNHPNYQFQYEVRKPPQTSSYSSLSASHGHREQRKGKRTEGRYFVDLPDGRRQIVDYYADHTGYHPTITYV